MSALQNKARSLVAAAVKKGHLLPVKKMRCADCGKWATCYDHRDYSKPLMVDPVCWKCNSRRGPGAPFDVSVYADMARYHEEMCAARKAAFIRMWNECKSLPMMADIFEMEEQRIRSIIGITQMHINHAMDIDVLEVSQ